MKNTVIISKYFLFSFIIFFASLTLWGFCVYFWFESEARAYIAPIVAKVQNNLSVSNAAALIENRTSRARLFSELEESDKISAFFFLSKDKKYSFMNSVTKTDNVVRWLNFEFPARFADSSLGWIKVYPSPEYILNSFLSQRNIAIIAMSFFALLFILAFLIGLYLYVRFMVPLSDFRRIVKDLADGKKTEITLSSAGGIWKDTERYLKIIVSKISDANVSVNMLFAVSKVISSQIEINRIFNAVTEMLHNKLDGLMCAVFLPGEDGMLKIAAKSGYSASIGKSIKIEKGNPVVDSYVSAKTTIIRNITSLEGEVYDYFAGEGAVAQMNAPITNEYGSSIGVLNVSAKTGDIFQQEIVDMVILAQKYLSVALRNFKFYCKITDENSKIKSEINSMSSEIVRVNAKLVQKVKDLKSLLAISRLDNTAHNAAQAENFEIIIQKIRDVFGFETSAFLSKRAESDGFYFTPPSFGYDKERL
ncbi:MAG: GAF domain-containing protein, partial [Endomicrobium sp.]|nr:GAF domain-containing protein [Endomicrobium sp.]